MSDHVWNLSEERVYRIGIAGDWRDRMAKFLRDNSYKIVVNRSNKYILKAEQRGLHVNFKPVVKIHVMIDDSGSAKVHIIYYARVKFVSAVAVGVLTGGISTLVGAGTFANHVIEAKEFFQRMWYQIEMLTGESHVAPVPQIMVESPPPAPVVQTTSTTYGNYSFGPPMPLYSHQSTYNQTHVYQFQQSHVPVQQFPQPEFMSIHSPGPEFFQPAPAPVINSLPTGAPPPLPPRTTSTSSWQQQPTYTYPGWGQQ